MFLKILFLSKIWSKEDWRKKSSHPGNGKISISTLQKGKRRGNNLSPKFIMHFCVLRSRREHIFIRRINRAHYVHQKGAFQSKTLVYSLSPAIRGEPFKIEVYILCTRTSVDNQYNSYMKICWWQVKRKHALICLRTETWTILKCLSIGTAYRDFHQHRTTKKSQLNQ